MYWYVFYYLNVIDQRCFSVHLHNKSLATGISFWKNPLVSNVLTGSSASSLCLYFSYSMSSEKQLSSVVLEGYLYEGVSLHNLCGFWYIFGVRTVFGLDACLPFPRHVLAVFPLIGVVDADAGPPHGSMFDSSRLPFPFFSFPFLPPSFQSSMEGGEE